MFPLPGTSMLFLLPSDLENDFRQRRETAGETGDLTDHNQDAGLGCDHVRPSRVQGDMGCIISRQITLNYNNME